MQRFYGYTTVSVGVNKQRDAHENETGDLSVSLLSCDDCGTVVLFPKKHREWHKNMEKKWSTSTPTSRRR